MIPTFLDWLDEQLDIEVSERGGFTDREAEDFKDSRKKDAAWVDKMEIVYNEIPLAVIRREE